MTDAHPLTGATIAITGGTGSFGRAFLRHLLTQHNPTAVRIISRDEAKQAAMCNEYPEGPTSPVRYIIGDVRDPERMSRALEGVDVCIHAAAMKQVPACEHAPDEAIRTNVSGTMAIIYAALTQGVRRTVLLSTDKAAAPNTAYGATKLLAERLMGVANAWGARDRLRFACTRYGNVLGSTGSILPIWREQLRQGARVTVTDPDMTRFLMTLQQAVVLVDHAVRDMIGGEVFVPKLQAFRLGDLAYALTAGRAGASIEIIGIRPREKIHETLIASDEVRSTRDCGEYYVIEPPERPWESTPPTLRGIPLPAGFAYQSDDTSRRATLRDMMSLSGEPL